MTRNAGHTWTTAKVAKDRQDLAPEDRAVEKRKVSSAADNLHLVQVRRQRRAESVGRGGLTRRSDIVLSALDRKQRRTPDRAQIDRLAVASQQSSAQRASVEDAVDVFDEVLGVEVHDRTVEVQEREPTWIGAVVVAGLVPELAALVEVSPQIGEQRGQLELRGVDQPAGAA